MGLAGASLLQLAGTAIEESTATRLRPTSESEPSAEPWRGDAGGRSGDEHDQPAAPTEETPLRGASAPRRRASCTASMAGANASAPDVQRAAPRRASYTAPVSSREGSLSKSPSCRAARKASQPSSRLPSMGSLLDGPSTRGHLKRQRESGGGVFDVDVEAPLSPCPSTLQARGDTATARSIFSGNAIGGTGAENGSVDSGESEGTTPIKGSAVDDAGAGSGGDGSSAAASASAQSRPSAGAKSLFSGAGKQWGAAGQGWQSKTPKHAGTTGYLTTAPAPDWRQHGLASLGRAASFDVARAAAGRNGLVAVAGDDKPRRASAFVSHCTALPPVVTEMGRRDSAFEQRRTPTARHVPHYSDLLSASTSFRPMSAFNGVAAHPFAPRPMCDPDFKIEEESEEGLSRERQPPPPNADVFDGDGDLPSWGTPGPGRRLLSGELAAAGADSRPSGLNPSLSRAKRVFHVMDATDPFTAGLPMRPLDDTAAVPPDAGVSGSSRSGQQQQQQQQLPSNDRRRWSVIDTAPVPSDQDTPATIFAPAWGETVDDETVDGDDAPSEDMDISSVGSERGNHHHAQVKFRGGGGSGRDVPSGRPPRRGFMMSAAPPELEGPGEQRSQRPHRWSVLEQSPTPPDQHGATAAPFVAAWGAANEEESAEEATAEDEGVSAAGVSARCNRRARVVFGGGGRGGGSSGDEVPSGRPPRRGSMVPPAVPLGAEAAGVSPGSQARRWSVVEQAHAPLDQRALDQRGATQSSSFVPAWGTAVEDRALEETSVGKDRGEAAADLGMGSIPRRVGVFGGGGSCGEDTSLGRSPHRRSMMSARGQGPQQCAPPSGLVSPPSHDQGLRMMGPPMPRRGSLVASALAAGDEEGSAAPPLSAQRRRGSCVGVGGGSMAAPPATGPLRRGSAVGGSVLVSPDGQSVQGGGAVAAVTAAEGSRRRGSFMGGVGMPPPPHGRSPMRAGAVAPAEGEERWGSIVGEDSMKPPMADDRPVGSKGGVCHHRAQGGEVRL